MDCFGYKYKYPMANRREMQERRANLREKLVEACCDGTLKSGDMLPPLRELAQQYGVSPALASEVVRGLAEEGFLYTQQGAGTFVGQLTTRDDLFLLVLPDVMETDQDYFEVRVGLRNGFESSLTRLGGTCLTLSRQNSLAYHAKGDMEGLVGVAEFCVLAEDASWNGPEPHVTLREMWAPAPAGDTVYLDNERAGRQAAQHLLNLGHRRIAYLGAHQAGTAFAGDLDWSRQRLEGWKAALLGAGCCADNLAFCPRYMPENEVSAFLEVGLTTGRELATSLGEPGSAITAVVASNANSTESMFEALREAGIPESRWPAVVSFDDCTAPNNNLLSVLRPSWEELGRQGAALLWERSQGRLAPEPQQRPLPMELIPRFSCRPQRARVLRHPTAPAGVPPDRTLVTV